MALIVDSSVFIALERHRQRLDTLEQAVSGEPLALAAITVSELLAGVHRADSTERRLRRQALVETIIEWVPVLPFDLIAARTHAVLWAHLTETGSLIGAHDLLIAATAVAHDYAVLTDNLRDFNRVPGLAVQQPRW